MLIIIKQRFRSKNMSLLTEGCKPFLSTEKYLLRRNCSGGLSPTISRVNTVSANHRYSFQTVAKVYDLGAFPPWL
jgi:hypothetical protein